MKRWLCLALCMVSLLWGCQSAPEASDTSMLATTVQTSIPDDRPVVGVCLPQKDGIWADRVSFWEEAFAPYGYQVQLFSAKGDVAMQILQIQKLASTAELLIIAPVDSAAISPALQEVTVPVIAYDSMITNTDKVSFLATFDYNTMGQEMARQIYSCVDTAVTLELFMAQAETEQSLRYYEGLMEGLSEHIDTGFFTISSGRVNFEDTSVAGGLPELAEQTLQRYLQLYYSPAAQEEDPTAPVQMPDVVIAGSDQIAQACLTQLDDSTILCGLGGDQTQGLSYSIEKDYAGLDAACLTAALALLEGKAPETNLESGMFNNVKDLPCWMGEHRILYLTEETAD